MMSGFGSCCVISVHYNELVIIILFRNEDVWHTRLHLTSNYLIEVDLLIRRIEVRYLIQRCASHRTALLQTDRTQTTRRCCTRVVDRIELYAQFVETDRFSCTEVVVSRILEITSHATSRRIGCRSRISYRFIQHIGFLF